jgi:YD repeat-containing protein
MQIPSETDALSHTTSYTYDAAGLSLAKIQSSLEQRQI